MDSVLVRRRSDLPQVTPYLPGRPPRAGPPLWCPTRLVRALMVAFRGSNLQNWTLDCLSEPTIGRFKLATSRVFGPWPSADPPS